MLLLFFSSCEKVKVTKQKKQPTFSFFFACDKKKRKVGKKKKETAMNTIFVKARKISKSLKGNRGSAVNYSKYILREMKGIDYTDKGEILASGIEGTQESPIDFWRKVEERENQTKRKDTARFAKEYIMALPSNLPQNEMQNICESVAKILAKNNRVVQWAMHEPDKAEGSNENNFHCHFLMSERECINGIFAETKNREWNSKAFLNAHKKAIGAEINRTLERLNLPKWSVEIGEDIEPKIDKTENQIRAERANKKSLRKAENKLKLAEVKLNGLGRTENGIANSVVGNSELNNGLAEQFAEFQKQSERFADFQRTADSAERAERARQAELERKRREIEEQRKRDKQRLEEERRKNQIRPTKPVEHDSGWSR